MIREHEEKERKVCTLFLLHGCARAENFWIAYRIDDPNCNCITLNVNAKPLFLEIFDLATPAHISTNDKSSVHQQPFQLQHTNHGGIHK